MGICNDKHFNPHQFPNEDGKNHQRYNIQSFRTNVNNSPNIGSNGSESKCLAGKTNDVGFRCPSIEKRIDRDEPIEISEITLDISYKKIDVLNFSKCEKIKQLDCSNNNITIINNVPDKLEILICSFNPLYKITYIPKSLKMLVCDGYYLKYICPSVIKTIYDIGNNENELIRNSSIKTIISFALFLNSKVNKRIRCRVIQ